MALGMVASVGIPLVAGAAAGYATAGDSRSPWYAALDKPPWTPPSWVFGPVWTALYLLMGLACWRVVRAREWGAVRLFAVQLALNVAWSFLFFKARRPDLALVDIAALLAALVATAVAFYRADRVAGLMLAPYVAWVAFATALNAEIVRRN